jgi:hypothetical protein
VPRCRHRSPRQPTLGADLGVADASTDDIYAAMDWLAGQQDHIEADARFLMLTAITHHKFSPSRERGGSRRRTDGT